MPKIFDNLNQHLLPTLQDTLKVAYRADFCIGYFRLSGWQHLDRYIDNWIGSEGNCCRLLIGISVEKPETIPIDNQTAIQFKKQLATEFREQLAQSIPTNQEEATLRRLAQQLREKKVIVKLFLRSPLHAKLYLLFREDKFSPVIGYLGSSNLTYAGLSGQGELNVDVVEGDACQKLAAWFEARWQDRWCLDISEQLIEIIQASWAREELIPPYHIYLKMAYHLSQEARAGLNEFTVPREFGNKLFDYQAAAVRLAARHLNQRGGVLIGDVVGLGKTLMATALAKIFENVYRLETLIICPKNLVDMWKSGYCDKYLKMATVLSVTMVKKLAELKRYQLVIIDESHNLRNREGQRYKAIRDYIDRNDCKVVLLSATPYNKTYLDLANQLRLFIAEDKKLSVSPEKLIAESGGMTVFTSKHQCNVHSLAAYEKSEYPEDWRKLMRLYMVRRTRSFIQENYALTDAEKGQKYLLLENGQRAYFPARLPKTASFKINNQYAKLYSETVVNTIAALNLPRYGLGQYLNPKVETSKKEQQILKDLSRGGKRLIGFCRTNLFKRLESSGAAFILSLERLLLRNSIYWYAISNNKDIPIGAQNADLLDFDSRLNDGDTEDINDAITAPRLKTMAEFQQRAAEIYDIYTSPKAKKRFKWLDSSFFSSTLTQHLQQDSEALFNILKDCGDWDTAQDAKLNTLEVMLTQTHPDAKVLIFTQFADTAFYLQQQLVARGLTQIEVATGQSPNPTKLAWRFSPLSNDKKLKDEIRVLIATDVLSEGQNLQDAAIVVNYDLPWAIIRLIQRVGRVDRIGQKAYEIICYSFLPAAGVEKIIKLRARLKHRLRQNAEVVGTDEAFFEDDDNQTTLHDLYNEKAGILDGDADNEVDLVSEAYAVWTKAIKANPKLEKIIPALPPVVHSTKSHHPQTHQPTGVLVYMDTPDGNDAMMWLNNDGNIISESLDDIFKAAACHPDTPALERSDSHHAIVKRGVEQLLETEKNSGGGLGRKNGARYRTYIQLKDYAKTRGTLLEPELEKAIDAIYKYPLRESAVDILNFQLRSQAPDETLAATVMGLYRDDRLCVIHEYERQREPRILCSLGLKLWGSATANLNSI
ncbi:MAG: helicase-related protein [Pseudomonadota bacterium]